MRGSEALLSPISPTDAPLFGTILKRSNKAYLVSLSQAFVYVWEHHREVADWFIKADDDTYVILENLKDLLKNHNSGVPIQFGHRFKHAGVGQWLKPFSNVPGIHGRGIRICHF